MKKILISMIAFAMLLSPACDKIKDATSRDIKVNNIKFDFKAKTEDVAARSGELSIVEPRAGATTSFTVERLVDLSELGSADVLEYANKINKVVVNNALINVTANPNGNYTLTNLTFKADGVTVDGVNSLVVPSYTMGGAFTAPANMLNYMGAFIMRLVAVGSVKVTVSGQSDAPPGTELTIRIESDAILTASLL